MAAPIATEAQRLLQDLKERALAAFCEHRVTQVGPGHWVFRRLGTGAFYVEVVALTGCGHLLVAGDIDTCAFSTFSRPREATDEDLALAMLRWIGGQTSPSGYVEEKARIGLTDRGQLAQVYESEVAREEIQGLLREEDDEDRRGVFAEALHYTDERQPLLTFLYEATGDAELVSDLGMVTSPRVIWAWAAVRQLMLALVEVEAEAGT